MPIFFTTIDGPSAVNTDAYGINNAGQIVGGYDDGNGPQGYLLSGGIYTTLNAPTIIPGHSTVATGINASAQIVGFANPGAWHGFLYSNGMYTTIDSPNASGAGGGTFPQGKIGRASC